MKSIFTLLMIIISSVNVFTQSIFEYKGYLQNLQSVWVKNDTKLWSLSGTVTNRFDFSVFPADEFTFNLGLRNILDYGQNVQEIPGYADFAASDNGYFNLIHKWSSDSSYLFYSSIDRINLIYSGEQIEFQLGRQRINWGINLVWTPNDIFNSTSYLNFDYEERQGSDAVRAQYYLGTASSAEVVYKIDSDNKVSAAAILKFNNWNYDFQLLGGTMTNDYVFGGGWSGYISSAGFAGEFTYFRNKHNFSDTTGILVSSLGVTYTFPNELYIHGEFLYNSAGTTGKAGRLSNLFSREYNAKNLSPAKYSIFAEVSYPVTPLIKFDFSSILNPSDKSFYVGPFVDISLIENLYLLAAGQFFFGDDGSEWGDFGQFYYLRLKWNF